MALEKSGKDCRDCRLYRAYQKYLLLRESIKSQLSVYVLIFIFMTTYLAYIIHNKSLFEWDPAMYGSYSVYLYDLLINQQDRWFNIMITMSTWRAPMIAWIGQFFVGIGRMIGSVDTGLLLSVFITNLIMLFMLYSILKHLFKDTIISFIGCLFIMSAPLFAGVGTRFFTEPLQTLTVTWFMYISIRSREWDSLTTALNLITASSFALLVKVSSPVYCIGPGLIAMAYMLRRISAKREYTKKHIIHAMISLMIVFMLVSWYNFNLQTISTQLKNNTKTPNDVTDNVMFWLIGFWLDNIELSFFMPINLYITAILFITAVSAAQYRNIERIKTYAGLNLLQIGIIAVIIASITGTNAEHIIPIAPYLALATYFIALVHYTISKRGEEDNIQNVYAVMSITQILFFVFVYSIFPNIDMRYLLPISPYIVIMICWSLKQIGDRRVSMIVFSAFTIQFLIINSILFGIITPKDYIDPYWVIPIDREGYNAERVEDILSITCNEHTNHRTIIVGTSEREFNPFTLQYHERKKNAGTNILCNYVFVEGLDQNFDRNDPESHIEETYAQMVRQRPSYYVTSREIYLDPDKGLNRGFYQPITAIIRGSERFERHPLPKYPEIMIMRYKR
ncbi:MAG: hypothetical protein ABIH11_02185 [Candidatus Altiarchaeota archaeon]